MEEGRWVQNGALTRRSKGLMETARVRTSTSRGFRSGTGTPCLTSSTSGPPKRGTTTARQLFSAAAAAVDAGRAPAIDRRALTALHHITLRPRPRGNLAAALAIREPGGGNGWLGGRDAGGGRESVRRG